VVVTGPVAGAFDHPVSRGPVPAGPSPADLVAVTVQLGRPARSVVAVAHRCGCGLPDVVTTAPRLPDGTPFPTTYYMTCPRASSAVGRLEGFGVMAEMTADLHADPALAAGHRAAHTSYLAARSRLGEVPEIAGVSAGGMPDRVKCLHVLAAHELANGPDVNPLGARVVARLDADGRWGGTGRCVDLAGAPLTVRPAGAGDLEPYLAIRDDAARWMAENGIPQWSPGEYAGPAAAGLAAGDLFVAELAGVTVGGLRLMDADPDVWPEVTGDPGAGWVHGLVVDRSLSGTGTGGRLLEWAADRVTARGGRRLRLDCRASNDRLRAYYPAHGFAEVDVRDVSFSFRPGVTSRLARFVRDLPEPRPAEAHDAGDDVASGAGAPGEGRGDRLRDQLDPAAGRGPCRGPNRPGRTAAAGRRAPDAHRATRRGGGRDGPAR